ncbi:hypothetical protein BH11ARM2_BH11ARM2_01960 [soil metagenome]
METLPQWELVYSLALALNGREMAGQRRFLLQQILDIDGNIEAIFPTASEPNSLVVLSLHALAGSCRGFGTDLEIYRWILRLRPTDASAGMYVALSSKMPSKDKLALLQRCRPSFPGEWQEGFDDRIRKVQIRIQMGQVGP